MADTADPNAAAQTLAAQTYATGQQRADAGKAALLDKLASTGTYANDINYGAQAAVQPQAPQVATAADQMPVQTQATAPVQQFNVAAQAAATALAAHQMAQQQAASSNYFDQVKAAIPIEQSRAQSQAAQIYQQLINDREQRAQQLQLGQLQLEQAQASLAATKAAAAAKANGTALTPSQRSSAFTTALDRTLGDDPNLTAYNAKGQATGPNAVGQMAHWLATAAGPGTTSDQITAYAQQLGLNADETQYAVNAANNYYDVYGQLTGAPASGIDYSPSGSFAFSGATASGSGTSANKLKKTSATKKSASIPSNEFQEPGAAPGVLGYSGPLANK